MRIFRDVELVEQLGSGIPRILEHYSEEFTFFEHFLQITFLTAQGITPHVTEHVTEQVVRLLKVMSSTHSRTELMEMLQLNHRGNFRTEYLQKALNLGLIELTIPDKPKSIHQKYRLTQQGKAFLH